MRWRDNEILWTVLVAALMWVIIWNHEAVSAWTHKIVVAMRRA